MNDRLDRPGHAGAENGRLPVVLLDGFCFDLVLETGKALGHVTFQGHVRKLLRHLEV